MTGIGLPRVSILVSSMSQRHAAVMRPAPGIMKYRQVYHINRWNSSSEKHTMGGGCPPQKTHCTKCTNPKFCECFKCILWLAPPPPPIPCRSFVRCRLPLFSPITLPFNSPASSSSLVVYNPTSKTEVQSIGAPPPPPQHNLLLQVFLYKLSELPYLPVMGLKSGWWGGRWGSTQQSC